MTHLFRVEGDDIRHDATAGEAMVSASTFDESCRRVRT